jgi:hypothetical protein
MGVDHGRIHVGMAQEFLNGADVIAIFEQMRREGVPEDVQCRERIFSLT